MNLRADVTYFRLFLVVIPNRITNVITSARFFFWYFSGPWTSASLVLPSRWKTVAIILKITHYRFTFFMCTFRILWSKMFFKQNIRTKSTLCIPFYLTNTVVAGSVLEEQLSDCSILCINHVYYSSSRKVFISKRIFLLVFRDAFTNFEEQTELCARRYHTLIQHPFYPRF